MKKNMKISVIVPIFNAEQFLEKCIDSIRLQTYKNLEIILINDGSTDGSLGICEEVAQKDDRIIIIDKPNGGVASARNCGIDYATGDYIGFVDSDDYIDRKMYKSLLMAALENDADIVECGYARVNSRGMILDHRPLKNDITTENINCCRDYLLKKNTTNFNVNKLYRNDIFMDIRYSNLKYSEDYLVNAQAFYKCNKKVTIKGAYYFYLKNVNSASGREFRKEKFDIIKAGKILYEYYNERIPELCPFVAMNLLDSIILIYKDLYKSSISDKGIYSKELMISYKYYYKLIANKSIKEFYTKTSILTKLLFRISPKTFLILSKMSKRFLEFNRNV